MIDIKNFLLKKRNPLDYKMLAIIVILVSIGLIILASASSYYALNEFGNSNHFWIRQLGFAVGGVACMFFISLIDYRWFKKLAYIGFIITLILMALVLIPGIGHSAKGATRWLNLGFTTFQPSELMKIVLVISASTYLVKNVKKLVDIKRLKDIKVYIPLMLMLATIMGVMYLQDHLSGTLVMIVGVASVFWASGVKINIKYIIGVILVSLIGLSVFILGDAVKFTDSGIEFGHSFRLERIIAFANSESDLQGSNWQVAQSLYAIGTGNIFGLGLGQSRQKYLWLPEAQNDFIFSVLGEELGLIGTISVLGLFMFFIYRGLYIAIKCDDLYGSLIATGITMVYAFQIVVNIAVVTCTMPVTGMPLPFFSYGGTALLINLATMGILLNISRTIKH